MTKRSPPPAGQEAPPAARPRTDPMPADAPTAISAEAGAPSDAPATAAESPRAAAPPSSSAPDLANIRLTEDNGSQEQKHDAVHVGASAAEEQNDDNDDEIEIIEPKGKGKDNSKPAEQPHKRKGIPVESLATIREMYEKRELFGYPEEEFVKYPHNAELNNKLVLWQGDLTKLRVDCIVNAANKSLLGGGGVDGAIHSAAGPDLYHECRTLHGCETGETKLTKGYRLPAAHVAHTVGPVFAKSRKRHCEEQLRSCYRTTLDLCAGNGIRSVAFSGISTGVYGYPIIEAANVACDEVRQYLDGENGSKLDKVVFCVFRAVDKESYLDAIPAYFPPPAGTALADDAAADDAAADEAAQKGESGKAVAAEEGEGQVTEKEPEAEEGVTAAADADPKEDVKEGAPAGDAADGVPAA